MKRDISAAEKAETLAVGATTSFGPTRAIYVGGTGDIEVTMAGGGNVTFTAVPAGQVLAIAITGLVSATATDIVALY